MPSSLVNRYAVYFHLPEEGRVRNAIANDPSLLIAIESCVAAYRTTGHIGFVIEDQRNRREFVIDRDLLLRLLLLKRSDSARYFEILNRLDRDGNQDDLVSFLRKHAPM